LTCMTRPWCGVAQFPGLAQFMIGTVHLPVGARHDEIVAALEAAALRFLPPGFQIIEPQCGAIFFSECEP